MGNKRMIDGGVAESHSLNRVSRDARLTFFLLLTHADSYGRFRRSARLLMAGTYPEDRDVTDDQLECWVQELVREHILHVYQGPDCRFYFHFPKWETYQELRRRGEAKLPDPEDCRRCLLVDGELPDDSGTTPGPSMDQVPPEVEVEVEREVEVEVSASAGPASPGRSKSPTPIPDWATAPADLLIDYVSKTPGGRITPKSRNSWARQIVRLVGEVRDLKELENPGPQIEAGIHWLFSSANTDRGKYALVVESGETLREKWPKIVRAAQREHADSPEAKERRRAEQFEETKRRIMRGRAEKHTR